MGTIVSNGEDGGGDTHQVSETNHRETGAEEGRRGVGDSKGRSSAGSNGNPLGNDLHRYKTGAGGTVGVAADNFRGICKGDGL